MRGMLEKLEDCMTDVPAMLKEVKEALSTGQVVDQCSARKKVAAPADELREMAESRAKAWLSENSAADAWMADLKEFEESRESSSGAESMLTCSEVEVLTEERTHAGIAFPGMLKTEHGLSMSRERSSVRQGVEESSCRNGYRFGHGVRWDASRRDGGGEADAQAAH